MGLFGQLSDLFKGKPVEQEISTVSVSLNNLPKWFKQKADPIVEEARENIKRTFSLIQQEVKEALRACELLEIEQLRNESIPEKVKLIMHGNRRSYLHLTRMLLATLSQPSDITYKSVMAFLEQFEEQLSTYTKSSQKNYLVLQEFFKDESKVVAMHIKRINELVRTLLDNPYKDIITVSDAIYRLTKLQRDRENVRVEWQQTQEKMKILHAQIEKNRIEIGKQMDSFEYARVKEFREEKERSEKGLKKVEEDISLVFSPLLPALKKFSHIDMGHEVFLAQYVENPSAAVKADTHLTILMVLPKVVEAIEAGKIDLKDKKRQKALEQAKQVTEEYLKQYQATISMLENSLAQVEKQLKSNPVIQSIEEYSYRNEHLKRSMAKFEEESLKLEKGLEQKEQGELQKIIIDHIRKLFSIEVKLHATAHPTDTQGD